MRSLHLCFVLILCLSYSQCQRNQHLRIFGSSAYGHFSKQVNGTALLGYQEYDGFGTQHPEFIEVLQSRIFYSIGNVLYLIVIQMINAMDLFTEYYHKPHVLAASPEEVSCFVEEIGNITDMCSYEYNSEGNGYISVLAFTDGKFPYIMEAEHGCNRLSSTENGNIVDIECTDQSTISVLYENGDLHIYGYNLIQTSTETGVDKISGNCFEKDGTIHNGQWTMPAPQTYQCLDQGVIFIKDTKLQIVGNINVGWFPTMTCTELNPNCFLGNVPNVVSFRATKSSLIIISDYGSIFELSNYKRISEADYGIMNQKDFPTSLNTSKSVRIAIGNNWDFDTAYKGITFVYGGGQYYTSGYMDRSNSRTSLMKVYHDVHDFSATTIMGSRLESMVFGEYEAAAVTKNKRIYRWGTLNAARNIFTGIPIHIECGDLDVYPSGLFFWEGGLYIFKGRKLCYEGSIRDVSDPNLENLVIQHVAPYFQEMKIFLFTSDGLMSIERIDPNLPVSSDPVSTNLIDATVLNVQQVSSSPHHVIFLMDGHAYCRGSVELCCLGEVPSFVGNECVDTPDSICAFGRMPISNVVYVHAALHRSFLIDGDGKLYGCGYNHFKSLKYTESDTYYTNNIITISENTNAMKVWGFGGQTIVETATDLRTYGIVPGVYALGDGLAYPTETTRPKDSIPLKLVTGSQNAIAFIYENITECSYRCILEKVDDISKTIEVFDGALVTRDSKLVVQMKPDEPMIWNYGDESVVIEGGEVVLVVDSIDPIFDMIAEDPEFSYNLVKGNYQGTFDTVTLEATTPSDRCDMLEPTFKTESTQLSVAFNINNTNCNEFPWWGILLIVLGVLVTVVIVIVVILKTRKCRSRVVPFRDR